MYLRNLLSLIILYKQYLLCGVLQTRRAPAPEEVEVGEEVVRAPLALQAGDELEEDPVDAVADGGLVPLQLARVLLALVQEERLHDVGGDGVAGEVEVVVAEGLQDGQALATAPADQQPGRKFVIIIEQSFLSIFYRSCKILDSVPKPRDFQECLFCL